VSRINNVNHRITELGKIQFFGGVNNRCLRVVMVENVKQ